MGICAQELKQWVIKPTLSRLDIHNKAAVTLLLATAAQESSLGHHLKTRGKRALGIYQIHSLTHRHIWDHYLVHHPDLASTVRGLASQHDFLQNPHAELATNLSYATAIAWLIYARHPEFKLPANATIKQLAKCWKRFYHPKSKATCEQFIDNYQHLIMSLDKAA